MTFRKILATTTLVGMMGTAAFATGTENDINFTQSGGSTVTVNFGQTGQGNVVRAFGSPTAAATVVGSLSELRVIQIGDDNTTSFDITTPGSSGGIVKVILDGDSNTSNLIVTQDTGDTLDYQVLAKGDNNGVISTISAFSSLVKLNSVGNNIAYNIEQTGAIANANVHSIDANVGKTGTAPAQIRFTQSGLLNTIAMGSAGTVGLLDGTGGLTLNGAATVEIRQTAADASYTSATHTIADGGSLNVVQQNF